jgi:hypothetical protein
VRLIMQDVPGITVTRAPGRRRRTQAEAQPV